MEMEMAKQERSNSNWECMLKCWSLEQGTHRPFPPSTNVYDHPVLSDGTDHHRPAPQWRGKAKERFMKHRQPKYYDIPDRVYDITSNFTIIEEDEDIFKYEFEDEDKDADEEEEEEEKKDWLDDLDELQEYAEFTDVASVLHSEGRLFSFLRNVLSNKHADIRAKIAEVVTTMVQNYPTSQQLLIEEKCLQLLFDNFTSDPDETSRTKALGAISSIIRNNKSSFTASEWEKGYAALREALISGSVCQREVINLIEYLLHENNLYSQELKLTSSDDAEVREAALSGLLVLERVGNSGQLVKNDDKLELPSAALPTVQSNSSSTFPLLKKGKKENRSSSSPTTLKRSSSLPKEEEIDDLSRRLCEWTQILARLPAEDLLEFKLVCKSWCDLIESFVFNDLHTTFNNISSSSSFGSFILLASVNRRYSNYQGSGERSLIMLSSESGAAESSGSGDDWPWRRIKHDGRQVDNLGSSKDHMIKVDEVDTNNNLGGGGGGGGGGSSSSNDQLLKLKSLGFPCYDDESCYSFKHINIGSCNGLVCIYDRISIRFSLWNPATEKSRILPRPIEIGKDWPHHLAAFGFDVETKDYKVVLLTGYIPMFYRSVAQIESICRVQVYSLSTDSWRLLEGITCLPGDPFRYPDQVLYLNGSCFFLAKFFHTKQQPCYPESDRFIISFDFTKEIIIPIQLPDHHLDQELYLSSLGDKIALFTKKKDRYQNGTCCYEDYNIWVLKEHGSSSSNSSVNKESWTKLQSFQIKPTTPDESNIPIGISNDGEFALLETRCSTGFGNKMKLYNLVTKEVKRNFLSCNLVMSKAIAYKPNLVSIMRGKSSSSQPQLIG